MRRVEYVERGYDEIGRTTTPAKINCAEDGKVLATWLADAVNWPAPLPAPICQWLKGAYTTREMLYWMSEPVKPPTAEEISQRLKERFLNK